jgi:Ala-tRNA(Pro) deacylase
MFIDQTQYTTRPTDKRIPQELAIYDRLEQLEIPYVRVDHDLADTIEICHEV